MKLSTMLNASVALGLSCGVESFVMAPLPARQSRHSSDFVASSAANAPRSHMITHSRTARTTATRIMMAGFGAKKKETPPLAGAGKGQKVYERQMRAFNGLRGAGAEGVDVYVHREGDDKFIFMGKAAWSSGITVEQALQVRAFWFCVTWVSPWKGMVCCFVASRHWVLHSTFSHYQVLYNMSCLIYKYLELRTRIIYLYDTAVKSWYHR